MKDATYIMTKAEMKKFKNPLTLKADGSQQEQNYVLSHLTGSKYLIHLDGTLFQYLQK